MTSTFFRRTGARSLLALALTLLPLALAAKAQDTQAADDTSKPVNPCVAMRNSPSELRTFYLFNAGEQPAANEILVAIRNLLCPGIKIYLVAAQNAIVMQSSADQLALAQKIIHDLDRPRKAYRLTYTITELDAGKTVGTEHLSMIVVNGQHTSVKEGDKVPVATGSYSDGNATPNGVQTQFTYLDVGMNFDATLNEVEGGAVLKSKVEQSSLGQPSTIAGVQEPVVRQTVLEGISILTLGKPVLLGSIDVPTTTHRFDIAVVLEQIK
jgi:type II secretory pathway component GspD/PulD (secretin)